MNFSIFIVVFIAFATSAFAQDGTTSGTTFERMNAAAIFQTTCPVCGGRVTPEGCKGPKKPKPTTKKVAHSASNQQCGLRSGGCTRPLPFPPKKPKGPKTKIAFYQADQTELAATKAIYTYGLRKRRRIAAYQTTQEMVGTAEKTHGGFTMGRMNKHLAQQIQYNFYAVSQHGIPVLAKSKPRSGSAGNPQGGGGGGNPYSGGGGGARKGAKK